MPTKALLIPDRSEESTTLLPADSSSCLARLTKAPPAGDGSDESFRFSEDIVCSKEEDVDRFCAVANLRIRFFFGRQTLIVNYNEYDGFLYSELVAIIETITLQRYICLMILYDNKMLM